MFRLFRIGLMVLAVIGFSGCSNTAKKGGAGDGTGAGGLSSEQRNYGSSGQGEGGAETMGLEGSGAFQGSPLDDPASPLSTRIIYFDYDSSEISPADRDVISAHARYLAGHPDARIYIEGHSDERGTREYNIGLGDRRARSVQRLLQFQGVQPSQIQVVSYGEEKPAVDGHSESAWRLNRRVELVYPQN